MHDRANGSENNIAEPPRRPTKNGIGKNRGVAKMRFSEPLRGRTTLEAQPLIFRRLFFDGGRKTSDTEASGHPRLRTEFDIEKTRGFA